MARIVASREAFAVVKQKTLQATQAILVKVAKREHARVMQTDPQPASFTRYVDGRQGAPEEQVRPNGVILYTYPRLDAVAQFAMETLFDLSPVLSGEYRIRHTLFLNGVAVTNLEDWEPGDEVLITNFLPYARKIELGVMKMRVPGTSQVYEQTVAKVNRRFGNVAKSLLVWRGIIGAAVSRSRAGNKSEVRYPGILIVAR